VTKARLHIFVPRGGRKLPRLTLTDFVFDFYCGNYVRRQLQEKARADRRGGAVASGLGVGRDSRDHYSGPRAFDFAGVRLSFRQATAGVLMSETDVTIRVLDAAYKPFPPFEDWASRTSVDTVRWERYNDSLTSRARGLSPEVLERARNVAKRAAALDTGAIEGLYEVDRGFTYTVALETATWEAALAKKGAHVRPLFEAQLHAYDYVLDLATKSEPISEAAIRALHEEVCRAQSSYRVVTAIGPQEQPLPKGQYKTLPNHVRTRKGTDHSYAPVDVTPAEMARLTTELRAEAFLAAHPVMQAAYAHYCLVAIHPFADGNGRVARALASAFTYRAISMPIVILSEQRDPYLSALESADSGNYQEFVDFMLARSLDTIGLVSESLRSALVQDAQRSAEAIKSLYVTRGGYTHEEVDQIGEKLIEAFQKITTEITSRIQHAKIGVAVRPGPSPNLHVAPGYRLPITGPRTVSIAFSTQPPVRAQVSRLYALALPRDPAGEDDVQLVAVENSKPIETFVARVDELTPAMSGVLQIRLTMFAERVVNEMFAELKDKAEKVMGTRR
jgi:Fic family protein